MMVQKANAAAEKFISLLTTGSYIKDSLPNSFENYSDFFENADLELYRGYIKTYIYKEFIGDKKVKYYGE